MVFPSILIHILIGLSSIAVIVIANIAYPFKDTFPDPFDHSCQGCPRVYVPICGSDNRTYINYCRMACRNTYQGPWTARATMQYEGPCTMLGRIPKILTKYLVIHEAKKNTDITVKRKGTGGKGPAALEESSAETLYEQPDDDKKGLFDEPPIVPQT